MKNVRNDILHNIVMNKKKFFSETHIDSTDVSIMLRCFLHFPAIFPAVASDKKE